MGIMGGVGRQPGQPALILILPISPILLICFWSLVLLRLRAAVLYCAAGLVTYWEDFVMKHLKALSKVLIPAPASKPVKLKPAKGKGT